MPLIEQARAVVVRHVLSLPTFLGDWPIRRDLIRSSFVAPANPTRQELIRLGEQLAHIFQLVGQGQRTNADVAGGGAVWGALVAWYLNLCYAGTDAIAFCAGKHAPAALKDAMSITYQNTSLRSDSDVLVLSLPGLGNEPNQPTPTAIHRRLAEVVGTSFQECGLVNIQCKTNWNDNAQIPMLWNLIFQQSRVGTNPPTGFLVGKNGFHIRNLAYFAYSFVTVPTTSGGAHGFTPTGMPVRRVASLSGGAFWGHPTQQGICRSMGEFFGHQYSANGNVMPNVNALGVGYVNALTANQPLVDTSAFGIS